MTSNSQCDPCSRVKKSSAATKWCVDCEDALCNDCMTAHRGSKASMHHQIKEQKTASVLQPECLVSNKQCAKHPEFILEFVCACHDSLCCKTCISEDHHSCNKVIPIETASVNAKGSSLYKNITLGINQIQETLNKVLNSRRENKYRIKQEERSVIEAVSTFKAQLIKKLDELETRTLLQLKICKDEADCKITNSETEIEQSQALIEGFVQQLNNATENGSNQLLFFLLHELQPKLANEQKNLESILSEFSNVSFVYKESKAILDLEDIGSVELEMSNILDQKTPSKCLESNKMSQGVSPRSFKFGYSIEGKFSSIRGMVVDKYNYLLLRDTDRLLMYSQEGKYVDECPPCKLKDASWNISQHPTTGKIVVGTRSSSIQFVTNFMAQPPISVPDLLLSTGVTWVNDKIFAAGEKEGEIFVLDSDGHFLRTIPTNAGVIHYLHFHDDKVYFTDDSKKLYCVKEDGTRVFTKTCAALNGALGITTDQQGYVYVAGYYSNNIVRLSSDGKDSKVVLEEKEGIRCPNDLCFSRDYKKLFIASDLDVKVFDCE